MNIFFISSFNNENIELAKIICKKNEDQVAFWISGHLEKSRFDFSTILESSFSDFFEKSSLLPSTSMEASFLDNIVSVIFNKNFFKPDVILFRGVCSDFWFMPLLKNKFNWDIKFSLILDKIPNDINDLDLEILNSFDFIFSLDRKDMDNRVVCNSYKIFENFEFSLFRKLEDLYLPLPDIDENSTLIITDTNNYKKHVEKHKDKENISIIDICNCPQEELSIYLNVSKYVVNCIDDPEFNIILSKMNKISVSEKEFENLKYNIYKSIDEGCKKTKIKEDFELFIENKILKILRDEADKSVSISGFEINI